MALGIKKGDTVVVMAGKDAGKKGKVLTVLRNSQKQITKLIIEGVHVSKRRTKPRKQGEKGGVVDTATPISISSIAMWCSTCGKGTRLAHNVSGDNKSRVCYKCKGSI